MQRTWEVSNKQRMTEAALETKGLERRMLRRGKGVCRETAARWAKSQPWYDRVVTTRCTPHWWVWFCEPEGGR